MKNDNGKDREDHELRQYERREGTEMPGMQQQDGRMGAVHIGTDQRAGVVQALQEELRHRLLRGSTDQQNLTQHM